MHSAEELPTYTQVYRTGYTPEWDEAWQVTEALLVDMQRLAESAGAQLLVCYLPEQNQVSDSKWNEMMLQWEEASTYDRDRPNRFLGELCARRGIAYLDLIPAFREHVAASGPYPYFPVNAHFNVEGNRLAAQVIRDHLVEQGMLPDN